MGFSHMLFGDKLDWSLFDMLKRDFLRVLILFLVLRLRFPAL